MGLLTIAVLVGWQSFGKPHFAAMPGALLATIVAAAAAVWLQLPVLFVEVPDSLWEETFFPTAGELAALLDPGVFGGAVA